MKDTKVVVLADFKAAKTQRIEVDTAASNITADRIPWDWTPRIFGVDLATGESRSVITPRKQEG